MSSFERTVTTGLSLREELEAAIEDRTLDVVGRRRHDGVVRRRGWLVRRMLLLADVVGLLLAMIAAEALVASNGETTRLGAPTFMATFVVTLPCWILAAKLYGLYDHDEERTDHTTADDIAGVFHLVTVGTWMVALAAYLTALPNPPIRQLAVFWAAAIVFVTAARTGARTISRTQSAYLQNTIIVGAGQVGQLVARKLLQHPEYGINLVGFVDADPTERRSDLGHLTVLGSPDELEGFVRLLDVERVIVAFSNESNEQTLDLIRSLKDFNVQIDVVPRLFEVIGPSVGIHTVEGLPLLGLPPVRISRSSRLVKRAVDIVGALIGVVAAAPLLAFIAVRIKLGSEGPVLFRQERLGMNMQPFTALKFRTMRVDANTTPHAEYVETIARPAVGPPPNGTYKLDQGDAMTSFGRWLRRNSLDELPQLVNVLRGEMSLVGPRPCLTYETDHFADHHFERFLVPAGLTGLWQVTARSKVTFLEALEMDVTYVRSWSLALDARILIRTPLQVLRRMGAA